MTKIAKELQEIGEWKVGQKVLVVGGRINREGIYPIERITDGRGGTIYVGNTSFNATSGRQIGGDTCAFYMRAATEEDYLRIRGKNAAYRLSQIQWSKLDPAKVIEIEKLLNDNGIDTKKKT